MTATERRELVTRPLPTARVIAGKSWAGCYLQQIPVPPNRVDQGFIADDEVWPARAVLGFGSPIMPSQHSQWRRR